MRNLKFIGQLLAFVAGLLFFVGCQQETVAPSDDLSIDERYKALVGQSPNVGFYGVGPANELYFYHSGPPVTLFSQTTITGLRDSGEVIVAIDVRPKTGQLFGVSNMSNIYWIRTNVHLESHVPMAQAFPVAVDPFKPAIEGTMVGFDFEATSDQIRLVTDTGQNLVIDPNTGQVTLVDVPLGVHGSTVMLNSAAVHTSPYSTIGSTTYSIDAFAGNLYKQSTTQDNITLVGSTGLTISGDGGFDITQKGVGLAVMNTTDATGVQDYRLYNINLKTGAATSLGTVSPMIGIATY
jgi:hypothetical protein